MPSVVDRVAEDGRGDGARAEGLRSRRPARAHRSEHICGLVHGELHTPGQRRPQEICGRRRHGALWRSEIIAPAICNRVTWPRGLTSPFVPAKAGTQGHVRNLLCSLDSRMRGNEQRVEQPQQHKLALSDQGLKPVPPQRWHFIFLSPTLRRPLPSQFLHFGFRFACVLLHVSTPSRSGMRRLLKIGARAVSAPEPLARAADLIARSSAGVLAAIEEAILVVVGRGLAARLDVGLLGDHRLHRGTRGRSRRTSA